MRDNILSCFIGIKSHNETNNTQLNIKSTLKA